uniref:Uncharacterized protein n=1 Tax=Utricularia reniformis TaxID=192314 RepID=A0A1Y0B1D7_9LAMI|nr:hypothetical protein AEK19_MT1041 [Utricularia reniformis]ART31265.1 hypothetical protein AEK19_MT1041 [Utricularia reniformis]
MRIKSQPPLEISHACFTLHKSLFLLFDAMRSQISVYSFSLLVPMSCTLS